MVKGKSDKANPKKGQGHPACAGKKGSGGKQAVAPNIVKLSENQKCSCSPDCDC